MSHSVSTPQSDDAAIQSKIETWASLLLRASGRSNGDGMDPESAPSQEVVTELVHEFRALLLMDLLNGAANGSAETRGAVGRRIAGIHDSLRYLLARCSRTAGGAHTWTAGKRLSADPTRQIQAAIDALFNQLPRIREHIVLDLRATYDGDPACRSTTEAALCYPGVYALAIHRVAHELHRLGAPLLPRMMNEVVHRHTGIDIHPGAQIGQSCCIDHGTGVVIGETTIIESHCRLYQGVTLGAKSVQRDPTSLQESPKQRHPTLQDHVIVYAGATILGGETVIGAGSVIGGGVFLTSSVPPGSIVTNPEPERVVRRNPDRVPPSFSI